MVILFHKPFGVLSQFTPDHPGQRTLAEFDLPRDVYVAGRLDKDSEGLLVLTDESTTATELTSHKMGIWKTYWVQVEGEVSEESLQTLRSGVVIQGKKTQPAKALAIDDPLLPERDPPIRSRKSIPTEWIEIKLQEGRNRQVRKMTAAVGNPTLRLIRVASHKFTLGDLLPGQWRKLD